MRADAAVHRVRVAEFVRRVDGEAPHLPRAPRRRMLVEGPPATATIGHCHGRDQGNSDAALDILRGAQCRLPLLAFVTFLA